MSYFKKKLQELNAEEDTQDSYWKKKMAELEERTANIDNTYVENDIAPVRDDTDRSWFQKGAFEDGYQFGDLWKTVASSSKDLETNVLGGILGMGEKAVDAGAYAVGAVGGLFNKDFGEKLKDFNADDLYDEEAIARKIVGWRSPEAWFDKDIMNEENSVMGEKVDSVAQSGGQLLGTAALQSVGVPWYLTTGVTSFGSETENAFRQGASYGEAGFSGLVSAGAEILTEKISGGIKFGGGTLDDVLTQKLVTGISNRVVRGFAKLGLDVVGEGAEEVLSEYMTALGQKLSYEKEETWNEILSDEKALGSYLYNAFKDTSLVSPEAWEKYGYGEAFVGGALLGGVGDAGKAVDAKFGSKRDVTSRLTAEEEKVFLKEYNDRLAEKEKGGKTLTSKQKSEIYDSVMKDLEEGGIDTDTIESVLGGDAYKAYKDTVDSEEALKKEFAELGKTKTTESTLEMETRYKELQQKIAEMKDGKARTDAKTALSKSVYELVKDSKLAESYHEVARRGQKFNADLTKYKGKQAEIVKKAMESGVLNNTRRSHQLVEMVSRIAADKGISVDFLNNAKLAGTRFAVDGKVVNGYLDKSANTIGLNVESKKYLNTVVGHEVTHVIEGFSPELYAELQGVMFKYAQSKHDYDGRRKALEKLYKAEEIDSELTADLVGDYLFTDADFVSHLHATNRNIFQKIYDEIKYLCKIATAGSKEARELERVKHTFANALHGDVKAKTKTETAKQTDGEATDEVKHSLGYHAGDLGKAEGYHIQGGSRDTGHFGTGTYFVGEEAKINDSYYGKRPHHAVEFDNYNLYKVHTDKDGYKLHENLHALDRGVSQEFLDAAISDKFKVTDMRSDAFRRADQYDEKVFDSDLGFDVSTDYIGASLRAMSEVAKENGVEFQSYDEWLSEQSDDVPKQGDSDYEFYKRDYHDYLRDLLETADEARNKGYDKFRDAYFDLWLKFGKNKVNQALQAVVDHQTAMEKGGRAVQEGADSNATVFMKALGYEGIDVRGTGLDNTAYGSVIYDLKGEDLARKQEIGTAKYSISIDNKWENGYNLYTATDDFVRQVPSAMRHDFTRSLANKTSGMTEGETRTVYVCGYIFEADGYMHGHILAPYNENTKKQLRERELKYGRINEDTAIASVWSETVRDAERGSGGDIGASRGGRSSADDRLLGESSERFTARYTERERQAFETKEEIDELVNKLREKYGFDAKESNGTSTENQANDIAPINETSSTDGVFFDEKNTKYSLSDPETDNAYLEAVKRGDMETAQKMVDDAAKRAGYASDSNYQGSIAFNGAAPSSNGYFLTKEERKRAFDNGEFEGDYSLGDYVDNGLDGNDLGWQLDNHIAASGRDSATLASLRNLSNTVKQGKRTIKMYRAVDSKIKENAFRNGDWITPSREYAQRHIGLQDWKSGRIIEQEVSIDDIWWNGDDINEWGYDDGKSYGYKNTKNNRKLLAPVTYDDNGNVIPLSARFNTKKADSRYSLSFVGETPVRRGNFNISSDDVRLQSPIKDAPIREDVSKTEKTTPVTVPEKVEEAPLPDSAPITEEEANALQMESMESLTDADAPPEVDVPMAESERQSLPMDEKSLKRVTKEVSEHLGLDAEDTARMEKTIQEYAENPGMTESDLFEEIRREYQYYEKVENEDDTLDLAKKHMRGKRIYVPENLRGDFNGRRADGYNQFRKENLGHFYLTTKEGALGIDQIYGELRELYPEHFPDIWNPADQLQQMAEVASQSTEPTYIGGEYDSDTIQEVVDVIRNGVNQYSQETTERLAEEERRSLFATDDIAPVAENLAEEPKESYETIKKGQVEGQQTMFKESATPKKEQPIKTVKDRLVHKLHVAYGELSHNKRLRRESIESFNAKIDALQLEYDTKKNKDTKVANDILRRIERLKRLRDEVDADYTKRINDNRANVEKYKAKVDEGYDETEGRTMRADIHAAKIDEIKSKFGESGLDLDETLKNAKNLSTPATGDNTPQRVMEKALGYKEGQALADATVNKVAQNESEGIKWLNSITSRKGKGGLLKQLSKQYHIKPGSKESAAAQMYAEGFYVAENGDVITYGDAELAKDFPNAQTQKNIKGLASDPRIRRFYDETLAKINESRTRNAYPEIKPLDNYYLHFRAMDDTFSRLGIPFNPNDIRAKDLPTDLNGVTADLKPGQPYFASAMHRRGKKTSHDLLGGIERYATGAKNQIYHIDDIQTLRALRNYIADTFGQGKGLDNLDSLSEEEAQDRIKQVFNAHLSTFAKFLNEEANVIAGKTALVDRGVEGIIGRRGVTFLKTINQQVGSNMVGMNVSSSLTNFLPVVQAFAKTNKTAFVKGFAQTIANKVGHAFGKADTFADNPTKIRRQGADRFYRTPWQKAADAGYALMGAVDSISTEIIVRAKYNELIQKGMSEEQAITEADKWTSRLMGDRSLGQMPQWYNSQTLGLITKFQLEVRNQLDSQFYDTIQEAKTDYEGIDNAMERNGKTAAKVATVFFELAVAQHLFGQAFESIAGYNPAFDIIDVLIKALGLDDDEESEDTALDNVEQGFQALLEDLPYTSLITDGGRIPISAALPIKQLVSGEDEYGNEKSRLETLGEIAPYYVLPTGYGQIKKTARGLSMFDDDLPIAGSYTDSGNLRFPVEDTLGNRIQAGVFGQWSSSNARDYIDNERKPLTEKQIDELVDSGMSIQEYWDYREGLSKYQTLEAKVGYINSLDLTVEQKNLLVNNIADRKEDIDMSNYDEFSSFDEFDFYNKNPDMHAFLENNGFSYKDYESADEDGKRAYTWAYKNPSKFQVSKAVSSDFMEYYGFKSDIDGLAADKDEDGKSIVGSRKDKVIDYVNSLDIDYGARLILFKSEYKADDSYNVDIINYLDNHPDISYEQMVMILKELGFTVSSDGVVSWD